MKQPSKKSSSEKENKKVAPRKQRSSNQVREDENNSIYNETENKNEYPYPKVQDKQFDNQPEFIDRNNDKKDKVSLEIPRYH